MSNNPTHHQIAEYLTSHIIDEMVRYLMEDYAFSLEKALEVVYHSHVLELLQVEEGELYVQSPAYCYELLLDEMGYAPIDTPPQQRVAED